MSNRRHFLIQGTLATCAVTFLRPLQSFSRMQLFNEPNKLIVLHSNKSIHLAGLKNFNTPVLKLPELEQRNFSSQPLHHISTNTILPYRIEQMAKVKIGIIQLDSLLASQTIMDVQAINQTALNLQQQHACHFIICVAYNNLTKQENNFANEKSLAALTTNIDLIICNKPISTKHQTHIAHNKKGHEVIIHASLGDEVARMDVQFNNQLLKENIGQQNRMQ
jgi:hypothetical protein